LEDKKLKTKNVHDENLKATDPYNGPYDVVFVSAYGRHNWLVRELDRNQWRVAHIDIGSLLGEWSEDDVRNPFGLAKTSGLNSEQFAYWQALSGGQKISNGLSILFDSGPFEGSGPLTDFLQASKQIPSEVTVCLRQVGEDDILKRWGLKSLKFEDIWMLNLSQQLSSTLFSENAYSGEISGCLPIFSEMYKDFSSSEMRNPGQFFKNLELVTNFEATHLSGIRKSPDGFFEIDLAYNLEKHLARRKTNLETSGEGVSAKSFQAQKPAVDHKLKTRVLVWGLSSAESEFLSHDVARFLYSTQNLEAKWSWQRFSFNGPSEILELWPTQFYMLKNLRLPWTHDNLCLISQKARSGFDVWMRIPSIFRFNLDYISELAMQFTKRLGEKFLSEDFACVDLPIETKLGKERLGPPRWPVYLPEDRARLKALKDKYLVFDSCEHLKTHQVQAQLKFQEKLFHELTLMRKHWLAVEAKAMQKAISKEIRLRN